MNFQKVKKLVALKKTTDTGKILKAAKLRLGVKGLKSKSKIANNSRSEGLLGRNLVVPENKRNQKKHDVKNLALASSSRVK